MWGGGGIKKDGGRGDKGGGGLFFISVNSWLKGQPHVNLENVFKGTVSRHSDFLFL